MKIISGVTERNIVFHPSNKIMIIVKGNSAFI